MNMMNNVKPLVSIIIPTYKNDGTLIRAVDSVISQDYESLEVFVVDDNDPANAFRASTETMMEQYKDDSRVHYIRHEKNKNGSAARNTGFNASQGRYICLLDDDDYFLPGKVAKQVDYLEKYPEFGGCYTWRKESFMGKEVVVDTSIEGDMTKAILMLEATPYTSALMLRRECYEGLNGFDESYYRHQDFEFMLRFFEKYTIGVVKEPLVQRVGNGVDNQPHGDRLMTIKEKFFSQFDGKIREIEKKEPGFRKKVYVRHYTDVLKDHIKQKNIKAFFATMITMFPVTGFALVASLMSDMIKAVLRRA